MTGFIVLIRGVNVGGNRTLPMAALRTCVAAAGFETVRSYIASGNLLVAGDGPAAAVERRIEAAVAKDMHHEIECVARTAAAWRALIAANPFDAAARERPKMLHLALSKRALAEDAAVRLRPRLVEGEAVAQAGGALWIDYAQGVAGTKLTAAMIDKAAESTVTARNWNSVLKLAEMADA